MRQVPPERVMGALRKGRRNIRSGAEVARRLDVGFSSVGFIIEEARRMGFPIASLHGKGYWIATKRSELIDTIRHLEHRKVGLDQTVRALRRTLGGLPG